MLPVLQTCVGGTFTGNECLLVLETGILGKVVRSNVWGNDLNLLGMGSDRKGRLEWFSCYRARDETVNRLQK